MIWMAGLVKKHNSFISIVSELQLTSVKFLVQDLFPFDQQSFIYNYNYLIYLVYQIINRCLFLNRWKE
jgi:hypothetical protein